MVMLADLVSLDQDAEFRNDVQLDAYDRPHQNVALLRSYLFSDATPHQGAQEVESVSPVGLLSKMIDAYLTDRAENRFVVIANYGHGKSHLGLALANYFGRAADASETALLLDKLDFTLNDPARSRRFHEFKESRGAFAVVRLRGDQPMSLRNQVLVGLEQALSEHAATKDINIPFWHNEAARILSELETSEIDRANTLLADYGLDLAALQKQVADRKDVYEGQNLHDLCVEVISVAKRIRPDLKDTSLSDIVVWASQTVAGPNKPLGGILFLFDEFSLYVERYAQRSAPGDLQELLNGLDNAKGRALFLAFAQQDPLTIAENLNIPGTARQSLVRELTRLPRKFALYSLMESVIDAYLRQDESNWAKFAQDRSVGGWFYQATDVAFDAFKDRYARTLRWGMETFQETVTRGCFPLHPITTAILCNMRFEVAQSIGAPRTVLGFVLQELNAMQDEPAMLDGRPNWVWPIALVDYFEQRMEGDLYRAYDIALRNAEQRGDVPDEWVKLLKALLLQEAARVSMRGREQTHFLAHAAGLDEETAKLGLKALIDDNVIRFDARTKSSSLWPASVDTGKLEKIIREKVDRVRADSSSLLTELNEFLADGKSLPGINFGKFPIKVDWGHADDWAAQEYILTADMMIHPQGWQFFPLILSGLGLSDSYRVNGRSISDGERGLFIWLLPRDEEELVKLRMQAVKVLDEEFLSDNPLPVLLVVPDRPVPELLDTFVRHKALKLFDTSERTEVGVEAYQSELQKSLTDLNNALASLRGDKQYPMDIPRKQESYILPKPYRIIARSLPDPSISKMFKELYVNAYPYRPPEFFVQYRVATQGANKLRDAVRMLVPWLLSNQSSSLNSLTRGTPVAQDLVENFLQRSWGILGSDYRIQEPTSHSVRKAWLKLDETFAPALGEISLKEGLIPLFNPPYGYDYNTALLIFAAWFGYHHHDLQVSIAGRRAAATDLTDYLNKSTKDFFVQVLAQQPVALARRDPTEARREVDEILRRVATQNLSQDEATRDLEILQAYGAQDDLQDDLRYRLDRAIEDLGSAYTAALEYDTEVDDILQQLARSSNTASVLTLTRRLANLPQVGYVLPTAISVSEVRARAETRLKDLVTGFCERYAKPAKLKDVELYRSELQKEKSALSKADLPGLVGQIDQALKDLGAHEARLTALEQEEQIRTQIAARRTDGTLVALYDHREYLAGLPDLSPETNTLRAQKLTLVQGEIEKLEERPHSWRQRLTDVTSSDQVRKLKDEIQRTYNRYTGSAQAKDVDDVLAACDDLYSFYVELERLRSINLRTQDDYAAGKERLRELHSQYDAFLTDGHQESFAQAANRLEEKYLEKQRASQEWIDKISVAEQNGGTPAGVLSQLNNPPSFLSEAAAAQLAQLRNRVQQKVDQDIVDKIELQFRSIQSAEHQQECLRRLEAVVRETAMGSAES